MRHRMLKVAGAAGLAISASAANAQITNGDFETGDYTGWTIYATNGTPVIDSSTFHGGSHSAMLGNNSGSEPNAMLSPVQVRHQSAVV